MKTVTSILTIAAVAFGAGGVAATQKTDQTEKADQNVATQWQEMRKEAVSARSILAGDVKNRFNPLGQVSYLILNEAGDQIEYVVWNTPYPYSGIYMADDGFVNYDAVDVEHGITGEINLIVKNAEVSLPRDQLKITRSEADHRMVDKLIGSEIEFADGTIREVEDILIQPETGKITHYVVAMDPDEFFDEELRTIRANQVKVSNEGNIRADLNADEVEQQQDFDTDFLG